MKLLDLKQVAAALGVHYETAREFVISGKLQGVRLGGRRHIQVRESDLEAFIEASLTGPEAGPKPRGKPLELVPIHRGQKSPKARPHEWRKAFRG